MGKTPEDEAYQKGVKAGKEGGLLSDFVMGQGFGDFIPGDDKWEIYKKGYEYGVDHRHDAKNQETKEAKRENSPHEESPKEEIVYQRSQQTIDYCPYCGQEEWDGDTYHECYCEEDEEDEIQLEDERRIEEEQGRQREEDERRKREAREERERAVQEKIQGKRPGELESILLFEKQEDPDVKIAAINQLGFFSKSELEFASQFDDSSAVREAARKKLQELRLPIPPELDVKSLRKMGLKDPRSHLGLLALQARFDDDPSAKRYALDELNKYLGKPEPEFPQKKYTNTYRCTRCGHVWYDLDNSKTPTSDCRMGCTNSSGWLKFVRIIDSIASGMKKPVTGHGELVESRLIDDSCQSRGKKRKKH